MNTHESHRFLADGDDNQECEHCQTRPYSQLAQTVCPDSPSTLQTRLNVVAAALVEGRNVDDAYDDWRDSIYEQGGTP